MININDIHTNTVIYRAINEVRQYYVTSIEQDVIYIKQRHDIEFTKIFIFELERPIYHLTFDGAKNWIGKNNDILKITTPTIYNRNFKLSESHITPGNKFYETAHGGSQFMKKDSSTLLSLYELEIVKIRKDNVAILSAKLYNRDSKIEVFGINIDVLLTAVNIHISPMDAMLDIVRSRNAIYNESIYLYNSMAFRDLLSDYQITVIDNEIEDLTKLKMLTNNRYEEFLSTSKRNSSINNIDEDVSNLLIKLGS